MPSDIPSDIGVPFNTRCWHCGKENDGCSHPEDPSAVPRDGDVSFCFTCGALAIFDKSMPDGVHKPTPSENRELKQSPQLASLYAAWRQTMKRKPR